MLIQLYPLPRQQTCEANHPFLPFKPAYRVNNGFKNVPRVIKNLLWYITEYANYTSLYHVLFHRKSNISISIDKANGEGTSLNGGNKICVGKESCSKRIRLWKIRFAYICEGLQLLQGSRRHLSPLPGSLCYCGSSTSLRPAGSLLCFFFTKTLPRKRVKERENTMVYI